MNYPKVPTTSEELRKLQRKQREQKIWNPVVISGGGGARNDPVLWGDIRGQLAEQDDLKAALDALLDAITDEGVAVDGKVDKIEGTSDCDLLYAKRADGSQGYQELWTEPVANSVPSRDDYGRLYAQPGYVDESVVTLGQLVAKLLSKANIYVRQAQGITTGNNIQGMHVKVGDAPVYTTDWSFSTADGQSFVRTDNSFSYFDSDGNETKLLDNGTVLIADYTIAEPFYISSITGNYSDAAFFWRYFDIKDLDQRIGLVSALETDDKSSVVNAINSLHDYVDAIVQSAEVSDSPFESYADFLAGSGGGIEQGKYAYVTFTDTDTYPSGGKWDSIAVGDTWRLDCGVSAWSPTSNMTAAMTATVADESGTNALKSAGNDTVVAWLQSFRNNLKRLLGMLKTDGDGTKALLDNGTYGAAGKVNKVNGISPDESITDPTDPNFRNVKTDYVFATEAEFNAADPTIPDGATVDKLWEYPDNYQAMLPEVDFGHGTSLLSTILTGTGEVQSAVVTIPDTGYLLVQNGSSSETAASVGLIRLRIYAKSTGIVAGYIVFDSDKTFPAWSNNTQIIPCAKGDKVQFVCTNPTNLYCALGFYPIKLVAKELPVVVEKNGSYSLDEVKTADTWIDGKPIYKRTIPWTSKALASQAADILMAAGAVDSVVHSETRTHLGTFGACGVMVYDGNLLFKSYNSVELVAGNQWYITIWYTKTTD